MLETRVRIAPRRSLQRSLPQPFRAAPLVSAGLIEFALTGPAGGRNAGISTATAVRVTWIPRQLHRIAYYSREHPAQTRTGPVSGRTVHELNTDVKRGILSAVGRGTAPRLPTKVTKTLIVLQFFCDPRGQLAASCTASSYPAVSGMDAANGRTKALLAPITEPTNWAAIAYWQGYQGAECVGRFMSGPSPERNGRIRSCGVAHQPAPIQYTPHILLVRLGSILARKLRQFSQTTP